MEIIKALYGEGICQGITFHLQKINIIDDFLSHGLGSAEVILEIQWLETLGTTHMNWKTQVMKFKLVDESVTLCLFAKPSFFEGNDEDHQTRGCENFARAQSNGSFG